VVDYYDHRAKSQKYWEISLRTSERKPKNEVFTKECKPKNPVFIEECKPKNKVLLEECKPKHTVLLEEGKILESNFGEIEYLDMYNDYLQLEKEIYGSNYRPYVV
jgi:hypothetical protein